MPLYLPTISLGIVGGCILETEGDGDVEEGNLAHGMTKQEAMVVVHLGQFLTQLAHFFCAGDLVGAHAGA